MMLPRRRSVVLLWCLLALTAADDTPSGLVAKDSEQDLVAEASQTVSQQAQKREAALSNSYGEPLPPDAYGPPRDIPHVDLPQNQPHAVYGVPDFQNTPPGAYGPPSPVVFPSQTYQGPPPPPFKPKPIYGPPKQSYGPPKQIYGPPKPIYGPPKKTYGPPKQSLPKLNYGAPFKQKLSFPKPVYGVPKNTYGPPKPIYGPPKQTYGPPLLNVPLDLPPVSLHQNLGLGGNINFNNIDLGLNLPAPIYGTPLHKLPLDLKPNFPIPSDSYGPPGHSVGPIGPNDQVVVEGISNVGHYGPPQPDPNPRPPHPGIPAPPTPPHVLYDGWKPIPGVSQPLNDHQHHNSHQQNHDHHQSHQSLDEYGPPPPPSQDLLHINLDQSLPNINHGPTFNQAQVSTGYSNVHHDALANIDLNSIVGGDSNHIDQSKTIFEVHYTEGQSQNNHDLNIIQALPSGPQFSSGSGLESFGYSGPEKPSDSYGAPPVESLSNGAYPASIRQQGGKGLIAPSGIYGVPPGSQYGAPPKHIQGLPIPYGSSSGGGHSGGNIPRHPIKFREPVPDGLIQQVGHTSHHKDVHGTDHYSQGPAYLSPPVREIKDVNQNLGNHGIGGVSVSIEPSNLFTLPHAGNPINFQQNQHQNEPSNLYGSPVDSYSVPLFTVDHTGSASNVNEVKASLDGTILANLNLSNADAAAILKHCPYHEAILRAAQLGEKIPSDLASSYVASLSSLGSSLSKNQQTLISPQNGFNTPEPGSDSVSYSKKDLASASHTLVQTILPSNDIKAEKTEKTSVQKGKVLKDESGKHGFKNDQIKFVSDQILQTSERIKNLSQETQLLQSKIVSTNHNLNQVNGQILNFNEIPVKGNLGSYSLQIQSADSTGKNTPSIPHDQLLSEGLLQSILEAIEPPNQKQNKNIQQHGSHHYKSQHSHQNTQFQHSNQINLQTLNLRNLDNGGLVLPAGYEPIDRTKDKANKDIDQEIQSSNKDIKKILNSEIIHRGDIPCYLKSDNSIRHSVIVAAPENNIETVKPVEEIDENDVAIYFNEKSDDKEPVTEISVATSISEDVEKYEGKKVDFGDKIKKS